MTVTSQAYRVDHTYSEDWADDVIEQFDSLPSTFRELMPTASVRLIIMLYDGAIAALDMAAKSLAEQDEAACHEAVSMVNDIVAQLYLSLDFDRGGEVASNLGRIYSYILGRTQKRAPLPSNALISEVRRILNQLHCSWREIDLKMTEANTINGASM